MATGAWPPSEARGGLRDLPAGQADHGAAGFFATGAAGGVKAGCFNAGNSIVGIAGTGSGGSSGRGGIGGTTPAIGSVMDFGNVVTAGRTRLQ
jgi:hypothetical protein